MPLFRQIVDENDNLIAIKKRGEVDFEKDIYRVAGLWLTDTEGRVLLAQRSLDNHNEAGKWGPAAAGTLEPDETYEMNIYKEAKEEIGLTGVKFKKASKNCYVNSRKFFCQWFSGVIEHKPAAKFDVQKEEVNAVAWFEPEALIEDLKSNPHKFLPDFDKEVKLFL